MATPTIDPTKQADYPIVLGDRLHSGHDAQQPALININYNYKSKSATRHQHSIIKRSSKSPDLYDLTITDKAPTAGNTLTYSYQGSVDPTRGASSERERERDLVLVFDPDRKAFVLEPVSTHLNFNLRGAPGKSQKQAIESYAQLRTLQDDSHDSGNEPVADGATGDDGPADESNPYDYRHFLPRSEKRDKLPPSSNPSPYPRSGTNSPMIPVAKPKQKPEVNPLRQKKTTAKPAGKPAPKPASKPSARSEEGKTEKPKPPSDAEAKPAPSPSSNIIVDGDLIIDMGSPPPSRPAFKVNPAHFSSNNTPSNAVDEDVDVEHFRLPSPAGGLAAGKEETSHVSRDGEEAEDDELAAEMEAAFEQSAREEEAARGQPYRQPSQNHVASDDESEVSEEE